VTGAVIANQNHGAPVTITGPDSPSLAEEVVMLIVAGTIQLDAAKRAEAEHVFEKMRAATLKEAGCLQYQAYVDRQNPGLFFMFERWDGQEALSAHFATPHMAEFGAALGALGVKGMDVKKYEVASEGPVP
jgi:quinol monooxygenase YgiN